MTVELLLAYLLLGSFSGFVAGLLGVGGGSVLVPLLTMLFAIAGFSDAMTVHMAIASSMSIILFTSVSSVHAHHKHGGIVWPLAWWLIPGVLLGSWIGPVIATYMNANWLAGLFGVFIVGSAMQMLYKTKPTAFKPKQKPVKPASTLTAGLGIGTLSGLVGSGGGFITVPFLKWRGLAVHQAVATSAVMGFPIALAGTLSYIHQGWQMAGLPQGSLGYIYLPAVAIAGFASIFFAPIGANLSYTMNTRQLSVVFSGLLLALAVYMFWQAFV